MRRPLLAALLAAFLCGTARAGAPLPDDSASLFSADADALRPRRAALLFVGDLMAHAPQLTTARRKKGYDFAPSFARVKPLLSAADLAVGNLETTLGGAKRGYTGYPCFNTPDEYADALKDAGFDALTTANNHCLDRRAAGLFRTLKELRGRGFTTFGTYAASADRETVAVENVNGITVAFLSWTYGTNGIPVPASQDWAVARGASWEEVSGDVARAKALRPDFIVAMPHIGVEYALTPPRFVVAFAEKLMEAGVGAVIASHPHVVQPLELRAASGDRASALIAWSMGNFISNQRARPRDMGVIARLTLEKENGVTRLVSADAIPTWVQTRTKKGARVSRVLPLLDALANAEALQISAGDLKRLRGAHADFTGRVLGRAVPLAEAQLAYELEPSSQDRFSTAAFDEIARRAAAKKRGARKKNAVKP
ncbi:MULTISPECIES: CapA family protein [unclassified Pyramidobacter]|uniref:CapA family protein n=1 Tax=unclassified Pyramidobacter TaxID=2632171 RepID=UPI0013159D56|nr:CapA family protein [Pyramidobacter sp. CG50-2]